MCSALYPQRPEHASPGRDSQLRRQQRVACHDWNWRGFFGDRPVTSNQDTVTGKLLSFGHFLNVKASAEGHFLAVTLAAWDLAEKTSFHVGREGGGSWWGTEEKGRPGKITLVTYPAPLTLNTGQSGGTHHCSHQLCAFCGS